MVPPRRVSIKSFTSCYLHFPEEETWGIKYLQSNSQMWSSNNTGVNQYIGNTKPFVTVIHGHMCNAHAIWTLFPKHLFPHPAPAPIHVISFTKSKLLRERWYSNCRNILRPFRYVRTCILSQSFTNPFHQLRWKRPNLRRRRCIKFVSLRTHWFRILYTETNRI